jgi:hydrogenase maturation protein HypF
MHFHMLQSHSTNDDTLDRGACRLILNGRVQGLGVRPTIYRLANDLDLGGTVQNTARGVEIELEGSLAALAAFADRLPRELPRGSLVERLERQSLEVIGRERFQIIGEPVDGPLSARLPVDMGVCEDCLAEIKDPNDRRHRYPFTSCTACGPRYTIIQRMPYERHDITMSKFEFCGPCREEYERPGDRRFHAQTDACGACGPHVWAVGPDRRQIGSRDAAVTAAVAALRRGEVVALRGVGGYQLLVDATREDAVVRLRQRKRRRGKPLAVMVKSLAEAARWAILEDRESETLADRGNPIVLVRARLNNHLARSVHPDFDTVGLMLPTTPLHALLADGAGCPLVCTSGNREGEPLEYEVEAAERNLAEVCDLWLHHDRPIARPIDDSVVRMIGDRIVTVRLARGLAPLSLELPEARPLLALGGFLKSAVAWSNGVQAVLGPHIGDQESLPARERYLESCEDWQHLYRFQPAALVHDAHPEYFSSTWAQQQNLPTVPVQHHHAHIVAGMLEHGWLDREVLGVAWDGTGYGTDGTIWGGEFLLARAGSFKRFACLRPFRMPGGEAAVREPWRAALAVAADAVGRGELLRARWLADKPQRRSLISVLDRPQFSPVTTSAGRLFDAAAALVTGVAESKYDGHPAMMFEAIADRSAAGQYPVPMRAGPVLELDWRPLIAQLLKEQLAGTAPGVLAMRFHRSLAEGIVQVCRRRADLPVVLAGGVFQNRLLTELIIEAAAPARLQLGLPGLIPPNDGGLAAGQLAAAAFHKEAN